MSYREVLRSVVNWLKGVRAKFRNEDMVTVRDIAIHLDARADGDNLNRTITAKEAIVTNDSRRVLPGGIFVAIKGARIDGNAFVNEATRRGANTIISEQPRPAGFRQNWLQVEDARVALAKSAALIHGFPSQRLALIGVTGTNGKTTTLHLVESIIAASVEGGQASSAAIGTIGYRIGNEKFDAPFTTPEAPEIQDFLRRAVLNGVKYAVMEVSSIALELHRADELDFDVAAFTNLTQDHLDFHGDLDSYFSAKKRLFDGSTGKRPGISIINMDDPYGRELRSICMDKVITYAIESEADVMVESPEMLRGAGLDGLKLTVRTPQGPIEIVSSLVGLPHAYNILCAVSSGLALGFENRSIAEGIALCKGVSGRFERVGDKEDISVFVDYAHTPDALTNVLSTIRDAQSAKKNGQGRVITVMGCGGDRDRTKRPLMGEEAARLSDLVIATSDNPRTEDPLLILNDIRVGLDRAGGKYELIVDRREAIFRAVKTAKPGDVILIAGKGHETYQILPTGIIDFDDRKVALEALAERKYKVSSFQFPVSSS